MSNKAWELASVENVHLHSYLFFSYEPTRGGIRKPVVLRGLNDKSYPHPHPVTQIIPCNFCHLVKKGVFFFILSICMWTTDSISRGFPPFCVVNTNQNKCRYRRQIAISRVSLRRSELSIKNSVSHLKYERFEWKNYVNCFSHAYIVSLHVMQTCYGDWG